MKSFWIERWKNNDTPWHLADPEPLLVRHIPKRPKQNVLVPLCGKSVDMLWLQDHGHRVFGIELSEIACRTFFDEAKIDYQAKSFGEFEIYESNNITIWCGDFFSIPKDKFPQLDFVYDRAAIIALPPEMRIKYTTQISGLAKACGTKDLEMLVILRNGLDASTEGPPFNVTEEELRSVYSPMFQVQVLETMTRPSKSDPNIKVVDTAYRLFLEQISEQERI